MKIRLLTFAACVLLLVACSKKEKEQQVEEVIRVTAEAASYSSNYADLPYVGIVEEASSTMVSFTGMAILKSVAVAEGQTVSKGQLLATIDDTQSRNALAAAKAALDQAKDAEERMKLLHENNSLPDMKWVEVQSQVRQAEASYALCQKNLQDCKLYAPVSGVVGSKVMGVGENVLPTEPVLTILNINTVKVRVSVPEKEIASIRENTSTDIQIEALGNRRFQGGRIEKGVSADPLTHTYDVLIHLSNPGHSLLPGMVAGVQFNKGGGGESVRAITLPVRAVQQHTDKSLFVWVARDKKAHRQTVTLGETVGNRVVIASGLSEGDVVITEGYQKLGEGNPVKY